MTQDPNAPQQDDGDLREQVIAALRRVHDPEIPVNLYDLGLIYELHVDKQAGRAGIVMTLTTPNCPEAESLPGRVQEEVQTTPGIEEAQVSIVWDPPWRTEMMSEEAKLILGLG